MAKICQYLCLCYSILLSNLTSYAQNNTDKNVVIRSQEERYEFVAANDAANPVNIQQSLKAAYVCEQYRTTIPFAEFYDDKSKIEDVRVYVDNDRRKEVKPIFANYSIDNIFYSDAKICGLQLDLIKKGVETRVELEKSFLDPRYLTSIYFSEPYPVHSKVIAVVVPRWMKIEIKEMNFGGHNISLDKTYDNKKDADIYTYTATNLAARENDAQAPGPSYVYPHLLMLPKSATTSKGTQTYFNKTEDLYAWYHSLVQQIGDDEAIIKQKALEITKGISSDTAKIVAVYQWVQDNIRYIAFEDGIAGFKPEAAQSVLQHKYGDCKGMANLTRGLLKALGFDARLCWIGTDHIAYDYSTPSMAVDNHMICALNYKGKRYFIDATETYIGFNQYAQRIQNRQVMIENDKSYILDRIPDCKYTQNTEVEKRTLRVDGNALVGTVQHLWEGESKEYLLNRVNGTRKEKINDAMLRFLNDDNDKYGITNLKTSDVNNWNQQLSINYDLRYQDAVAGFGDDMFIEMDFRKELSDFTIDTTKRRADYLFSFKHHVRHETDLDIPAGYKAELPANLNVDRDGYAFHLTYKQTGSKVIYQKEIIIRNNWLAKSAFKQWNEDVQLLNKAYLEQVTLNKK
ncbi:Transglutaminase-like superfamily protein [Chitinophaga jiangningensis]|uniref:Transglutaminase-like superfamily protein n=1 Tax=Chitinophaga jiangningensis TaxID=1419482 RepID=A0A1M7HK93_9BACT|nr:transglutaminase-like domain-containing protein [Chitinophaga jiangningensis]SHM28753.1 Transglutaminase-like superfamily protein [Chitinophaga jiangningensis]